MKPNDTMEDHGRELSARQSLRFSKVELYEQSFPWTIIAGQAPVGRVQVKLVGILGPSKILSMWSF